jgi:hypothetical protein
MQRTSMLPRQLPMLKLFNGGGSLDVRSGWPVK